jgi:hypothetical protein
LLRPDIDAGADEYIALRTEWDRPVHALAAAMLYEWDAIEPPPVS